ncbi:MAG TPA: NAD(P)H-quinone oxidoreductase [Allosphingosinicella sp.]|nr:NAD(P)H-quinone oxidoreductase [Allosphingosinicella sp.]
MTDVPTSMTAIDPAEPGGPEVLQPVERPVPGPGPGEYLIEVEAAGVNRPDVMQRIGLYPPPPAAPSILGLEVAGRVVSAGEGADASLLGEAVCALVAGGGYAQYCAAPAGQCLSVPPALTMIEAAAIPETFFTVWSNLFQRGGAKAGDTVLVHGGTSGIGTTAILLGRAFGLTVIVTAGTDEKCRRALEIGAAEAINYGERDFVEEVKRITRGAGVRVVLDMVGGDYLARNLACLAEEGRHVSIAAQRGAKAEVPIWTVMAKRLILTGSTLRARSVEFKSALASELKREVWPHLEEGRLKPVIDSVFPLAEAAEAHRRMESGDHIGKIVLQVR